MLTNRQSLYALPYVRVLGPEYEKLFLFCLKNRKRVMLDRMLFPCAFTDLSYIALSDTKYSLARNPDMAEQIAHCRCGIEKAQFFTNEMSYGNLDLCCTESEIDHALKPTTRAILGRFVCFTFECDKNDVGFLKQQLNWCIPANKQDRTPMFAVHRAMSRFSDFAGITVVYGGNKSLHIHVVFDSRAYVAVHGRPEAPYDSLTGLWHRLQPEIAAILGIGEVKFDISLSSSVAFRRTPWGIRPLEATNILGMPQGTMVEQVVVWEKWRERAPKGVVKAFLNASSFTVSTREANRVREARRIGAPLCGPNLSAGEIHHISERLLEIFPSCPRFDRLEYDPGQGEWVAYFYNSERDRNPSSMIREGYATVHAVGTDANLVNGSPNARLAGSLGMMIRLWQKQFADAAALADATPQALDDGGDPFFEYADQRRTGAAVAVACNSITTKDGLRAVVQDAARRLIREESISMLRATEGAGKSTGLLSSHVANMAGGSGFAMYAFGDYVNAEQKCRAFNAMGHSGYHGVVWQSFTRAYEEACKALKIHPLSMKDVCEAKERTLWSLIKRRQKKVVAELQRRHRAMWDEVGDRVIVIFTVHAVAHTWELMTRSRTMLHPRFWDASSQSSQRADTKLHMLVHDECSPDTFVHLISQTQYEWLTTHAEGIRYLIDADRLADAHILYAAGLPCPDVDNFEKLKSLLAVKTWESVTTGDTGEFVLMSNSDPEKDIYVKTHGETWYVGRRCWWKSVAARVLFLTTEFTPVAVARKVIPVLHVVDIDAPLLPRDEVEVIRNRMTSADAQRLAGEDQEKAAELGHALTVVTNRAKGENIISHAAAKGRNDLAGQNIAQYVFFPHPKQYERLQALNAFTEGSDLVLRSITDAINQTCGRNLGYRKVGDTTHMVSMPHRLYAILTQTGAAAFLRYDIVLAETAEQRYERKRN